MDIENMSLNRAKIMSRIINPDNFKIKKITIVRIVDKQIVFCFNPKFTRKGYRFHRHTIDSKFDFTFEFGPQFISQIKKKVLIPERG
jgi:hypothetical protein